MKALSIEEICAAVGGTLEGKTSELIIGPEFIESAQKNHITFIGNAKYAHKWKDSSASAAVVNSGFNLDPGEGKAFIRVKNADLAMATILYLFEPPAPELKEDIHPTAVVDESATIGQGCKIGANCYVGPGVNIESNTRLYPNVTILDHCQIGRDCIFWPGVVVRERSIIGSHCIFHNNVSIGADGFGYRPAENGHGLVKIPHIGNVEIGNYVEIGANSCVDKGKFSATILGDGCKIDNLVQIGHNCVLGKFCIMSGASGLAGSVTLGNGVIIGGSASIKDHTTIGDGAMVGAGSGVVNHVAPGEKVLGYPAVAYRDALKQWVFLKKAIKD